MLTTRYQGSISLDYSLWIWWNKGEVKTRKKNLWIRTNHTDTKCLTSFWAHQNSLSGLPLQNLKIQQSKIEILYSQTTWISSQRLNAWSFYLPLRAMSKHKQIQQLCPSLRCQLAQYPPFAILSFRVVCLTLTRTQAFSIVASLWNGLPEEVARGKGLWRGFLGHWYTRKFLCQSTALCVNLPQSLSTLTETIYP